MKNLSEAKSAWVKVAQALHSVHSVGPVEKSPTCNYKLLHLGR